MRKVVAGLAAAFAVALAIPAAAAGDDDDDEGLDLSSPERALRVFIEASRVGDHERAAEVLDLAQLSREDAVERGPLLARQLKFVLDQTLWIDWDTISDDVAPSDVDARGRYLIGHVPLGGQSVPITMRPRAGADGERAWKVSPATVAVIPDLYEAYRAGVLEFLPDWFFQARLFEMEAWQWVGLLFGLAIALVISLLVAWFIRGVLLRLAKRTKVTWDDVLVARSYGPLRLLSFLMVVAIVVGQLRLSIPARDSLQQLLVVGFIMALTYLAVQGVAVIACLLEEQLVDGEDAAMPPSKTRGARTQVLVLRKVATIVVLILGAALVLLQFEMLRTIGTSVLASAGVVGLVFGLAAQKSISSLLAGIQLSITQPIRIDDTVIVEGEWGWIEEITLTYVVVRVWDQRRLVVPVTRFLDQAFQNWTKASHEILGPVFIYADYRVPVAEIRAEVMRLCEASEAWDGRVATLLVTDLTDRAVELRALVSAENASQVWALRCAVREGLIQFLQGLEGGRYLPRARVELDDDDGPRAKRAEEVVPPGE